MNLWQPFMFYVTRAGAWAYFMPAAALRELLPHIHWYGIVQTQATSTHLIARCRCGAVKQVLR